MRTNGLLSLIWNKSTCSHRAILIKLLVYSERNGNVVLVKTLFLEYTAHSAEAMIQARLKLTVILSAFRPQGACEKVSSQLSKSK